MYRPVGALKALSVLVVDDDLAYVQYLQKLLSELGAEIEVAVSSHEARRVIALRNFDLVLTDLVLEPSGSDLSPSGLDVIQELRRIQPNTPVLVVSGLADEYRGKLASLGVPVIEKGGNIIADIERYYLNSRTSNIGEITLPKPNGIVESLKLEDIRKIFAEEAEKLVALKERMLLIPGERQFELPKPLQGFRQDIEQKALRFPFRRNVFVMMKYRTNNRDVADYIAETLNRKHLLAVRADDPDWNITNNVYNPVAVLHCCKYGLALFDEAEQGQTYSANVAYELGMMHQQNKQCLILRHSSLPPVPFDLIKDLYASYDRDLQLKRHIERWVAEISS
ncbi:MAG: response regulator [Terracidiphilus sp.]